MWPLYLIYAATFLFSAIMGCIILPKIISISIEKRLTDEPNERDVHKIPTPRLGGISFLPIGLMGVFLFNMLCVLVLGATVKANDTNTFLGFQACGAGALLLYLMGVNDDLMGVGFKKKFLAQILAGGLMVSAGVYIHNLGGLFGIHEIPAWVGMPLTIFLIVYITNGINLIDGVDGLASGICILTLSLYALMFMYVQHPSSVAICLSILGVLMTFFVFNVFGGENHHFRKLFMGDTGSLTLGYIISYMFILISGFATPRLNLHAGAIYLAIAPLVIPLLDIIRVMHARWKDGEPIFKADRRHIHHKLMRTGMTANGTMITLLLMTVGFCLINFVLDLYVQGTWILVADIVCWLVMHGILNYFIRRAYRLHPELEEKWKNPKRSNKSA